MKKSIFLITIALGLACFTATAQENKDYESNEIRTLAGNKNCSNGFYAGLTFGYSPIENMDAYLSGARLAWVFNHSFAFGIAGNAFVNDLDMYHDLPEGEYYLTGGYGGFFFEPIFFGKSPIHFSVPIILGAGGIYAWNEYYYIDPWDTRHYNYNDDWDAFFVVEPGLQIDFNVVRFMQLSLGASYRFTDDIEMSVSDEFNVGKDALRDISGYFTIKFGKF